MVGVVAQAFNSRTPEAKKQAGLCEFQGSLSYIMSFQSAGTALWDPALTPTPEA